MAAIHINNAKNCEVARNQIIRPGACMPLGAGEKYGNPDAAYGIFLHSVKDSYIRISNVFEDFSPYTRGFIGWSIPYNLSGNTLDASGVGYINDRPHGRIEEPHANSEVTRGQPVTIRTAAGDADGLVMQVQLLVNDVTVATNTTPPFNFELSTSDLELGTHDLKLKFWDDENKQRFSQIIPISIVSD
jgi:hypothetical protein